MLKTYLKTTNIAKIETNIPLDESSIQRKLLYYEGKEGNVLFNNALNTFYLWLYGVLGKELFR